MSLPSRGSTSQCSRLGRAGVGGRAAGVKQPTRAITQFRRAFRVYDVLDNIPFKEYIASMGWEVEYTDEFGAWFDALSEREQRRMAAAVLRLEAEGPSLAFPQSSGINGSRHEHMRELRIQIGGKPFRVFYAFDPRRSAILLIGGDKSGDARFYEKMIPIADDLYDEHLDELRREGLIP